MIINCVGDDYSAALIQWCYENYPTVSFTVVYDRSEFFSRFKEFRTICQSRGIKFINASKYEGDHKSVVTQRFNLNYGTGITANDPLEYISDISGYVKRFGASAVKQVNTKVVSFSGGRTSAYMLWLMRNEPNTKFIFMDTGMEHPKTYEFVRNIIKHWKVDITCLQVVINPVLNEANEYKIVDPATLRFNLDIFKTVIAKYGTPYNPGGAFCTDRMKLVPYVKYCKETFGRSYITYLGIREDEPRRLNARNGSRYLGEFCDFDKQDVLDWWKEQPFDLGIPEWLGNCVFCIKKHPNKIALAIKDEPELAEQFNEVIKHPSVRDIENKHGKLLMYRGHNSIDSIRDGYADKSSSEILSGMRGMIDTGICSESCEVIPPPSTDDNHV